MNLGNIHSIFLQNVEDLLKTKNGKKLFKEYISKIKKDKDLLKEFRLIEFIQAQEYSEEIKDIINESINFISSVDKTNLEKLHTELSNFLSENNIVKKYDIKNEKMFEAINNIIFSENKIDNVKTKVQNVNLIVEEIKNSTPKLTEEKIKIDLPKEDLNKIAEITLNKFKEKFYDNLNKEEKEIFNSIIDGGNEDLRIKLFGINKQELIDLINKLLKEEITIETREKLLSAKEMLLNKEYNKEKYNEDITSFAKLKKALKN